MPTEASDPLTGAEVAGDSGRVRAGGAGAGFHRRARMANLREHVWSAKTCCSQDDQDTSKLCRWDVFLKKKGP